MKKSFALFLLPLLTLTSCISTSPTTLTKDNASTYLALTSDHVLDSAPVKADDGTYSGVFALDSTKYGLNSDVKGEVTFTLTPEFENESPTTSYPMFKTGDAIASIKGTFVYKSILQCTVSFTGVSITLPDHYQKVSSTSSVSALVFTAASGTVQNG
jgi:hypothetical protein